ncbi:MAG TPA: hypothetical protein VIV60_04170 [Polyangiaceae bacterium]
MQIPPIPAWFNLVQAAFCVVSFLAVLVHLTLWNDSEREAHHKALVRIAAQVRERSIGTFTILVSAADLASRSLERLYGDGLLRRALVSTMISIVYLLAAGVAAYHHLSSVADARAVKAEIERKVNPIYVYSEAERDYAQRMHWEGIKESMHPVYDHLDEKSVRIREDIEEFEANWEKAIVRHPLGQELALLALAEGHPPETGFRVAPIVSFIASNAFLDLIALVTLLHFLRVLAASRTTLRFACVSILLGAAACVFGYFALALAGYFSRGAVWTYLIILFALPALTAMVIGSIAFLIQGLKAREHIILHCVACAWYCYLPYRGLKYFLGRFASLGLPKLTLPDADNLACWLLAFGCVGPTMFSIGVIVGGWLLKLFGGLLLRPLSGYLTVSVRANKNISLGLTVLPSLLLQVVRSCWNYLVP